MSNLFLDDESLDRLTGIRRGSTRAGVKRSKYQLQAAFLREAGIPFISNARGQPVVLVSAVESRRSTEAPKQAWQPAAIRA
ncbi:DUF4224 domain-containing protein [Herbaspirillum rubrisubalbicans]|uniref:DUF4224 domain-containing protein n=1 Tax=Herbaspirillum rubrisubalbicans TaxID=80842 RepID=UPI0003768986|nr:DUF4224 domain-containing protein [Herbaspirillum rubrisubalbicans]